MYHATSIKGVLEEKHVTSHTYSNEYR